jgi:hypothetical protein
MIKTIACNIVGLLLCFAVCLSAVGILDGNKKTRLNRQMMEIYDLSQENLALKEELKEAYIKLDRLKTTF